MNVSSLILEETEDFVVLNKPAGLLSIPDRAGTEISLKVLLKQRYGEIFTIHRLDRETSGVIVFAKNADSHKHLSVQFENRQTEKFYLGFVLGSIAEKQGSIDAPIMEHPHKKGTMTTHAKGRTSLTDFKVIDDFGIYSFVAFQIHSGRTHQIRVHMKHIGHPVVCDDLYGDGKPVFISAIKPRFKHGKDVEEQPILSRLALHAASLKFTNLEGKEYSIDASIPKDMSALHQQLTKWRGPHLRN